MVLPEYTGLHVEITIDDGLTGRGAGGVANQRVRTCAPIRSPIAWMRRCPVCSEERRVCTELGPNTSAWGCRTAVPTSTRAQGRLVAVQPGRELASAPIHLLTVSRFTPAASQALRRPCVRGTGPALGIGGNAGTQEGGDARAVRATAQERADLKFSLAALGREPLC
jgi:hypothetical protein